MAEKFVLMNARRAAVALCIFSHDRFSVVVDRLHEMSMGTGGSLGHTSIPPLVEIRRRGFLYAYEVRGWLIMSTDGLSERMLEEGLSVVFAQKGSLIHVRREQDGTDEAPLVVRCSWIKHPLGPGCPAGMPATWLASSAELRIDGWVPA